MLVIPLVDIMVTNSLTVGVDYEMFGTFDSEVPERTMDAMKHNHGNVDYAYTGTGEVVDLSSLQGLGADEDEIDDDGKSRRSMSKLLLLPYPRIIGINSA